MEVVIILIVVGILGYVFYQTLPNPKFQKANSLYDSDDYIGATKIFEEIFQKHSDAPIKLAECKLKQGLMAKPKSENEALKYFSEVLEIKKRLPDHTARNKYELVEAKAFFEIATIKFNNAMGIGIVESKAKNLKDNLTFLDNAIKAGSENNFSGLRAKHSNELAEIHFQWGIQNEKSEGLNEAVQNYVLAKDFATEAYYLKVLNNCAARIAICKLKSKPKDIEFVSFVEYNKADTKYIHDFYYRYVLYLLKKESYTDADTILKTQLNLPSKTIESLRELLKTKQVKLALIQVEEINNTIDRLYEKSFPVDDVKDLYENIDSRINDIKALVPDVGVKLSDIRPSLFNRLLSYYIAEEQFGNGINLIQKYPSFWETPELLKNLGICCYWYTAKGNISDKNYRIIISNWLTSVYSDRVILKSMENTTWDDNYTFTLTDAIGSNYQNHSDLPTNVNYEDLSDTNISIGSTQRELLRQFESLLHNSISDTSLSKTVHDFYSEQKEAIEKIVLVIASDVVFAAPYFAKSFGINETIIEELDNDFVEYSNEESLEAGVPYLKNNSDTYVREFATAKETISTMVSAIRNGKLNELKSVCTDKKKELIEKYESVNSSLEDSLFNAFTYKINKDSKDETLIPLMEECIGFVDDNEKLRAQCSNYIHDYCDAFWKTKPAVKLLELMIKSMKHNPSNYRAGKSITVLINNVLIDIANNESTSTSQVYSLIDEVKRIRSEVLKESLKELLVFRTKILSSLGTEASKTILLGYNLNSNGLKLKKVLDTMQSLAGGTTSSSLF